MPNENILLWAVLLLLVSFIMAIFIVDTPNMLAKKEWIVQCVESGRHLDDCRYLATEKRIGRIGGTHD